jgi:hypothetical protein
MARPLFALLVSGTLAAATQAADAKILITIDKATQQMIVEVDGVPRWQWPVSTGRRGYVTPSGTYTAFRMEPEHFSKEFDDAPMPHSIFFTRLGHAIHGSYETKWLGRAVSHGCVRLHPANAARLYALVEQRAPVTAAARADRAAGRRSVSATGAAAWLWRLSRISRLPRLWPARPGVPAGLRG